MPKGNPSKQTLASEKYQKKAGYMTKGFKLKREIVEQFEKACERVGKPQAAVIREFMEEFVQQNEEEKMTTGNRSESLEEKRKRHMKETRDLIDDWNIELQFAIDQGNQEYKRYCEFMLEVEKNTLRLLEKYEII